MATSPPGPKIPEAAATIEKFASKAQFWAANTHSYAGIESASRLGFLGAQSPTRSRSASVPRSATLPRCGQPLSYAFCRSCLLCDGTMAGQPGSRKIYGARCPTTAEWRNIGCTRALQVSPGQHPSCLQSGPCLANSKGTSSVAGPVGALYSQRRAISGSTRSARRAGR